MIDNSLIISSLIISVVLFILTYILLKVLIKNASNIGLVDVPNKRSAHKIAVPRGAGIVFGFVFILGILIFYFFNNNTFTHTYILLSLFLVYFIGIYDDIKDTSSSLKFLFIIIAACIAYFDGFAITSLGNYFGYELSLGYLSLPFTIFAVVGFTNALNLTDGLDGLAGTISIIMLLGLMFIGVTHDDATLIFIPLLLIASLLSFLLFNWFPAKIFMGDSGSLFLGFTISILSIYALEYINPVSILFLAAIPMLDTLIVMRRRKQRKQSLFVADKNHLHHILFDFKKDHLFTVKSLLNIQIIFVLIFVQVYNKSDIINLALFALLFSVFFNLFDPRRKHRSKRKRKDQRTK